MDMIGKADRIALSAGASAPEILVDEVLAAIKQNYRLRLTTIILLKKQCISNCPPILRQAEKARWLSIHK